MATRRQVKKVARMPQSPRHQAAKKRGEANLPMNRALRQAARAGKEGHFRFK